MAVKRYRIADFEGTFEAIVEIDDEKISESDLHLINNFWGGAEARVLEARGDITIAVLKLLWNALWWSQARYGNYNVDGVIARFASNDIEGWPPIDGRFGIKLIAVGEVEPPDDYYTTVTEISVPETEGSGVPA